MKISDLVKPEIVKVIILVLAIALTGRAIFYLLFGQPLFYFSQDQQQQIIEQTLGYTVSMGLMTILWPVIFAMISKLHESTNLSKLTFYSIIAIHTCSCFIAAFLILNFEGNTATFLPVLAEPYNDIEGAPKVESVIAILALTCFSVVVSIFIYTRKNSLMMKTTNA